MESKSLNHSLYLKAALKANNKRMDTVTLWVQAFHFIVFKEESIAHHRYQAGPLSIGWQKTVWTVVLRALKRRSCKSLWTSPLAHLINELVAQCALLTWLGSRVLWRDVNCHELPAPEISRVDRKTKWLSLYSTILSSFLLQNQVNNSNNKITVLFCIKCRKV